VEEEAEHAQNDSAFAFGEGEEESEIPGLGQVTDKNSAFVLINSTGIIQMANKVSWPS
jgi:hypothetical protein